VRIRTIIILVVVLVIVVTCAVLATNCRRRSVAPVVGADDLVFPELPVNDVRTIVFRNASNTVTIALENGRWAAPGKYGYWVERSHVRSFLLGLMDMKIGQVIRADAEVRKELRLLPPETVDADTVQFAGTRVKLVGSPGEELASFVVGKLRTKKSRGDEIPGLPPGIDLPAGLYIAVGEDVFLVAAEQWAVPRTVDSWLDSDLTHVNPIEIAKITVTGPDREQIKLESIAEAGVFELEGIKDDEVMDRPSAGRLANRLYFFNFLDLADPALPDEVTGLDRPTVYTATTRGGTVYTVSVGGPCPMAEGARAVTSHFARINVAYAGPDDSPEAEDARRMEEKLSPWIYVLHGYDAKSFLVGREALIRNKDEDD
jgi:hypothetical protein